MIVKEDCFAYHMAKSGTKQCMALKELHCEGCKFYKTKEEYEGGKNKYGYTPKSKQHISH